MNRYTAAIRADGGSWREVEVPGNRAIVKVKASPSTLSLISSDPDCRRIPVDCIDATLGDLTVAQRTALRDELLGMGYSMQEIQNRLGSNWRLVPLRQVLQFMATRRVKPRFDEASQSFVFDGEARACEDINHLTKFVPD